MLIGNKVSVAIMRVMALSFFVSLSMLSVSCIQDNSMDVHLVSQGVWGRVIGGTHNSGAPGLIVNIQGQSVVTDNAGNFTFNGIKPPYDVFVSDTLNKRASIYRGINSQNLWLPHDVPNLQAALQSAEFKVKANVPYSMNNMRVYFTDGLNTNGLGEAANSDSTSFTVYLSENKPVRGKIYVLIYTTDNEGTVTSYNRFGYIDSVYANPGSSISINVPDSVFKTIPTMKTISGSILGLPSGYSWSASFCVSMSPRIYDYTPASTVIMKNLPKYFSILVPFLYYGPGYSYVNVKLYDSSGTHVKSGYASGCIESWSGNSLVITAPQETNISSPPSNSVVDASTVFTRTSQDPYGLTHFIFSDSIRTFHVYTAGTTCTMKDFENAGIGTFAPGSKIYVNAEDIGNGYAIEYFLIPNTTNVCGYRSPAAGGEYFMRAIGN